ncbi:hypothetical protein [Coralloluteibacterium thermophilus]|uniref:Peptidoglycan-binding protein n=1 Tax=Coralloluteibacterium thermophilum TaxID=2707049 RepID=A0ABV9NP44_9GAMM
MTASRDHHDPHAPLDAEERALAERLSGLPRTEPPAALDAAIRAHAARAVGRRPAPALWGLGTAAAAVLALAVFWEVAPDTGTRDETALAPPLQETRRAAPTGQPEIAAMRAEVAPAEEAPAATLQAQRAADVAALRLPSEDAPSVDPAEVAATPVAPPAEAPVPEPAPVEALPPVRLDVALGPGAWIERIRAREAAGDRSGAVESLRLFRARHPEIAVPDDLEPLLR